MRLADLSTTVQLAVSLPCHAVSPAMDLALLKFLSPVIVVFTQSIPVSGTCVCDVPVSDWQPREILRKTLEIEGWQVRSIKAKDGCYIAIAVDPIGHEVSVSFNPATLVRTNKDGGPDKE